MFAAVKGTALSALLSLAALFLITKCIGRKQLSQFDFFDYINGITIGSISAELATELDDPLRPLTAMAVYGGVVVGLNLLSSKCPRARKYLNGTPSIVMDKGLLYRENMRKAKLELSEFMLLCRQQGYFDLSQIQTAIFECNGQLTILPTASSRPANPGDLGLAPPPACIRAEVILDGRVLGENLRRMGRDERWLTNALHRQGYTSPRQVYLGLCADDGALSLYPVAVKKP